MKLSTWQCIKCNATIMVRGATEVAHRCPSNQRLMTTFKIKQTEEN